MDGVIGRMAGSILSMMDITEVESERLAQLLRNMQGIEEIFEGKVVGYVRGWLRFCYLAELLVSGMSERKEGILVLIHV